MSVIGVDGSLVRGFEDNLGLDCNNWCAAATGTAGRDGIGRLGAKRFPVDSRSKKEDDPRRVDADEAEGGSAEVR